MSRAPQITSHSWERRERASGRKGGGLTVTPAASGTHLPPGNSSGMKKHPIPPSHVQAFAFTTLVYTLVSLMTSEKLSFGSEESSRGTI